MRVLGFLVSGLIPNRKAHPVIWQWFAIRTRQGEVVSTEPADQWLQTLRLSNKLPNRAAPIDLSALEAMRRPVIDAAKAEMAQHQQIYTQAKEEELETQLAELNALQARQVQQLDLQLAGSGQAEHFKAARREERLGRIESVFADYQNWVRDTLSIEPVPFIQIIAAFVRDDA